MAGDQPAGVEGLAQAAGETAPTYQAIPNNPAVTLDELRARLARPVRVDVQGVGVVELRPVTQALSLEFAKRLEKMTGAADLSAVGADMIRHSSQIPEMQPDDAMQLLAASGGFRGELFLEAARRCGVGELVDMMLAALESSTSPAAAGNPPAA